MSNAHFLFHQQLLQNLLSQVRQQPPFTHEHPSEQDQLFIEQLEQLSQANAIDESFSQLGQQLLCRVIAAYPHITPLMPRDLLWFFGGDCLHYMPDNEIDSYQQLDERRFEAEEQGKAFDYKEEKAKVFGLL